MTATTLLFEWKNGGLRLDWAVFVVLLLLGLKRVF